MMELEGGARATVQVKKLGSCRCLSVVRSGSRASEWRVLQAGYGRGQGGRGQGGLDIGREYGRLGANESGCGEASAPPRVAGVMKEEPLARPKGQRA